jgi:hypothetical protein
VKEAGSLRQGRRIKALDHARISEGPGGSAEMVPGQHHLRLNMYIAQAKNSHFEIAESLGVIDPKECAQGIRCVVLVSLIMSGCGKKFRQ